MSLKRLFTTAAVLLFLGFGSSGGTYAQDVNPEHLAAAKKALIASKATEGFDLILPQAAIQLKNRLAANNPDRADEIDRVVDEEAVALAVRRGALENEAAGLFTTTFTQAELEVITGFLETEAGQKYLASTPVLARELSKAARVWGAGVQRDLEVNATKKLQESATNN